MTATMNEGSALFVGRSPVTEKYVPLNGDPTFHEIASQVEGYDVLIELSRKVREISSERISVRTSEELLGAAINDGTSLRDVAFDLVDQERNRRASEIMYSLARTATARLGETAAQWVDGHLDELVSALAARQDRIYSRAADIVAGPVGGLRSAEDVVRRPELIEEYTELQRLTEDFLRIRKTVSVLLDRVTNVHLHSQGDPSLWDNADLIDNYTEVWPSFYLRHALEVWAPAGSTAYGTVDAEPAPWRGVGDRELFRWLLDRAARVWMPTPKQLRARFAELDRLQLEKRNERNAREIQIWNAGGREPLNV